MKTHTAVCNILHLNISHLDKQEPSWVKGACVAVAAATGFCPYNNVSVSTGTDQ